MKPRENQSSFNVVPLPPAGTYGARCYGVIDIGTVPKIFNGKQDGTTEKILLLFELPTELAVFKKGTNEKQPFSISQEFTLSFYKSKLQQFVYAWSGKLISEEEGRNFDYFKMLNKSCFLAVVQKTKTKFKGQTIKEVTNENTSLVINGITPPPKGVEVPKMINPPIRFDWDEPFNKENFLKLPGWIQKRISESEQFKKLNLDLDSLRGKKEESASHEPDTSSEQEW